MLTAIGIILADVLLFVFFVVQYRQELGITAGGAHDAPVVRKKPVVKKPSPPSAAEANPAGRGRELVGRP
jgi:hypothetical protein